MCFTWFVEFDILLLERAVFGKLQSAFTYWHCAQKLQCGFNHEVTYLILSLKRFSCESMFFSRTTYMHALKTISIIWDRKCAYATCMSKMDLTVSTYKQCSTCSNMFLSIVLKDSSSEHMAHSKPLAGSQYSGNTHSSNNTSMRCGQFCLEWLQWFTMNWQNKHITAVRTNCCSKSGNFLLAL